MHSTQFATYDMRRSECWMKSSRSNWLINYSVQFIVSARRQRLCCICCKRNSVWQLEPTGRMLRLFRSVCINIRASVIPVNALDCILKSSVFLSERKQRKNWIKIYPKVRIQKEALFSLTRIRMSVRDLCPAILHKMQIENLHNSIFYANIFIYMTFFLFRSVQQKRSWYWRANLFSPFFIYIFKPSQTMDYFIVI